MEILPTAVFTLTSMQEPWQIALEVMLPAVAVVLLGIFVGCMLARKTNEKKRRSGNKTDVKSVAPVSKQKETTKSTYDTTAKEPETSTEIQTPPAADAYRRTEEVCNINQATAEQPVPIEQKAKIRYNKSFAARLILSSDTIKEYYVALANKLMGYAKVRNRTSWALSSFNIGKTKLAKINVKGKTLYLYVALVPAEFADTKYRVSDVSDKKRYEQVPAMFKIRSSRALKFATEIIDILAERNGLIQAKAPKITEVKDYPADTLQNLIERGLIKVKITYAQTATEEPKIAVQKSVTVTQAQKLITNEAAATLVTVENNKAGFCGKKFIVNIDTLSANFRSGDIVDIAALKEKRIVPKSETAVKILARGILDKNLTVKADDFSADAVKMIVLTGGKAIRKAQ